MNYESTVGVALDSHENPSEHMDEREFIIKISGKTNGRLVDQLIFTTRKVDGSVHTYGPYGKTGNTPFEIEGNIVGFFGRSGALLDAIGVFYNEP